MSLHHEFSCDLCGLRCASIGDANARLWGIKFNINSDRSWEVGPVTECARHVCADCVRQCASIAATDSVFKPVEGK